MIATSPSLVRTPRILVVDDNAPLRYALARTLRQHGFDVLEAATGGEALSTASDGHPDLIRTVRAAGYALDVQAS